MKNKKNTRDKVMSLVCLTSACPIQYEGSLESGESLYIRARSGILEVHTEKRCIYLKGFDEFSDSIIQRLKHLLDFRQCDCFNKRKQKHNQKNHERRYINRARRLKSIEESKTIDLRAARKNLNKGA
jgi:hypothetical protein